MKRDFLYVVVLFCFGFSSIFAQDAAAPSNKCDPNTVPTEMISADGQLSLFCHPTTNCPILAQKTPVRYFLGSVVKNDDAVRFRFARKVGVQRALKTISLELFDLME